MSLALRGASLTVMFLIIVPQSFIFRAMFPTPSVQLSPAKYFPPSIRQPHRQHQQTRIRRHRQRRQHNNHIPTGAEPLPPQPIVADLRKELLVPLLSSQKADEQDAGAVDGEEGADGVELCGEDLEDDEGEGELA